MPIVAFGLHGVAAEDGISYCVLYCPSVLSPQSAFALYVSRMKTNMKS